MTNKEKYWKFVNKMIDDMSLVIQSKLTKMLEVDELDISKLTEETKNGRIFNTDLILKDIDICKEQLKGKWLNRRREQ